MADYYHDFKPLRNKLKQLNLLSALEILFPLIHAKKLTIDPEIAEFLFINILIYSEAPVPPKNENHLWNNILRESIKLKDFITAPQIQQNVWRWLHTMGLNQLKAKHNYYFNVVFRYYSIFSDPLISQHIEKKFGISYKSYFLCGIWIHSVFLNRLTYPKQYFTRRNNGGEAFSLGNMVRTMELLTLPLNELKIELKRVASYNGDIFITQGYPHVTHPVFELNDILYCMYPDYLLNQLTYGTYYLADIGNNENQLAKAFGEGFERYVGTILSKNNVEYQYHISPEIIYFIGKRTNLKTSDWIIETTDAIVFIECKTKKLRLNSKNFTDYEETLNEDLQHMVNAAIQLYKVYNHYVDGLIPGLTYDPDKKFFPLVVTLEDWFAGGPDTDEFIRAGIKDEFVKNTFNTSILDKFPFKSYSMNQLELDIQLMFSSGFVTYFERLNRGTISTEDRKNFPYIDYFNEEFDKEFLAPLRP